MVLSETSSRAAFIMAVTSLEVAVKQFISIKKPDCVWLIENIPSPPIEKIIGDYFPLIDPTYQLNDNTIKSIKNIVQARNAVIHRGVFTLDSQGLMNHIQTIGDLLHTIDTFLGYNWSGKYIKEPRTSLSTD